MHILVLSKIQFHEWGKTLFKLKHGVLLLLLLYWLTCLTKMTKKQ